MTLSADAFGWMARALRGVADKSAEGRIALVLEGGYDLVALEAGLLAATRGIVDGTAVDIARDAGPRRRRASEPGRARSVEDGGLTRSRSRRHGKCSCSRHRAYVSLHFPTVGRHQPGARVQR